MSCHHFKSHSCSVLFYHFHIYFYCSIIQCLSLTGGALTIAPGASFMTFRVPSHNHFPGSLLPLVGGQLDSAVAEGGVLHLDHLAAWGSRKEPCTLITPQRAPRPVSQLKVLLQANLKLKQEKLIVLVLSITFNLLPLNPKTSSPSWQSSSAGWSVSSPFPCW